jgi:parallel beta-helix repeat protein
MVIKRPSGSWQVSAVTQIPTGVVDWTYASATFVAEATEIWLDWRYGAVGPSPNFWTDDLLLSEGLSRATIGAIFQDLLDDATIDHAAEVSPGAPRDTLSFLKYDGFSDTVDNDSVAWDKTLSLIVPFGQDYLQMSGQAGSFGYETEMVWNAGSSKWELKLYNAAGLGTDYSAAKTPSVQEGMGIQSGQLSQIVKNANWALGVGAEGVWAEAEDALSELLMSRRETFVGDLETLDAASVGEQAAEVLSSFQRTAAGFKLTFHETSPVLPGRDFVVGDIVLVQLPSYGIDASFRVAAIAASWGKVGESTYTVDFGEEVVLAGAATSVYVEKILSEFQPMRAFDVAAFSGQIAEPFTGPIVPTVLVAAVDARPEIRAVADLICDGVDDQDEINFAIEIAAGGRVVVTDGTFSLSDQIVVPAGVPLHLLGMGRRSTTFVNSAQITNGVGTFIDMPDDQDSVIEGIGFIYTRSGASNNTLVKLGNRATARSCYFSYQGSGTTEFIQSCVTLTGAKATVEDSIFEPTAPGASGADVQQPNGRVINNTFAMSSDGPAVVCAGADSLVTDNRILGSGLTTGIYVAGNRVTVANNSIEDAANSGIWIDGGTKNIIANNTIVSSGENGILVDWDFNTVIGNTVDGFAATFAGINVQGFNNAIADNYIYSGSGVASILVAGSDNGLNGNYSYLSPDDGIHVSGDNNLIDGSRISSPSGDGIEIAATADGTKLGTNLITGSGGLDVNDQGTGTLLGEPLTTKGDIYTFDTAPAALPVGADDEILIPDSAEATGLKWSPFAAPLVATDPVSPVEGQIIVNTTENSIKAFYGGAWHSLVAGAVSVIVNDPVGVTDTVTDVLT